MIKIAASASLHVGGSPFLTHVEISSGRVTIMANDGPIFYADIATESMDGEVGVVKTGIGNNITLPFSGHPTPSRASVRVSSAGPNGSLGYSIQDLSGRTLFDLPMTPATSGTVSIGG